MAVALLGTPASNTPGVGSFDTTTAYNSFTYTVSAGSQRLLVLFVGIGASAVAGVVVSPTAISYGGVAANGQITGYIKDDDNFVLTTAWYWDESKIASASTNVINISSWSQAAIAALVVGAAAFSGVDQTTPFGTAVTATATSTTPSTGSITCPANGLIIGSMATDDDNTFTANNTSFWPTVDTDGINADFGAHAQYGSATGALTWTTDSQPWAVAGVPINPSGGGPTPVTKLNIGHLRPNAFAPGNSR